MLSRPVPAGAGDDYWRDQGLRLECAKVLHVYPYSDGPPYAWDTQSFYLHHNPARWLVNGKEG